VLVGLPKACGDLSAAYDEQQKQVRIRDVTGGQHAVGARLPALPAGRSKMHAWGPQNLQRSAKHQGYRGSEVGAGGQVGQSRAPRHLLEGPSPAAGATAQHGPQDDHDSTYAGALDHVRLLI
jgi:hypothetical protein